MEQLAVYQKLLASGIIHLVRTQNFPKNFLWPLKTTGSLTFLWVIERDLSGSEIG